MIGRLLVGMFIAASVLAGCGATSPSQDAPTPLPRQAGCQATAEDRLCVLVLGDSIASGVPLEGDDRWWVRLEATLGAALPNRRVVVDSWAVPGSRVEVLESAARDQPALETYDVAIVIEGVNDESITPLDVWRGRYEAAIDAIEGRGLIVVVGTPPPSFENGAFATRYDSTAEALREVADGRQLLDIAARWRADGATVAAAYYSDLIHQGEAGQQIMADMALPVVLKAIEEP